LVRTILVVVLLAGSAGTSGADTSLPPPLEATARLPTTAQAIAAGQRLWSAVRAGSRQRITGAVDARVRMWAALAGFAVTDNYEIDVDLDRFVATMATLELGNEPARDWHLLPRPPLSTAEKTVWVGATIHVRPVSEGGRQKIGALAFGVRFVGGKPLVVAFDVTYTEYGPVFSR
jgi:hypothetical protein